jgi:hypothetical protein
MVECQVFDLRISMLALDKLNFLIYLHQTLFGTVRGWPWIFFKAILMLSETFFC